MNHPLPAWLSRTAAPSFDDRSSATRSAQRGTAEGDGELPDAYSRAVSGAAERVGPAVALIEVLRRSRKLALTITPREDAGR